jgi:hypothetical protein
MPNPGERSAGARRLVCWILPRVDSHVLACRLAEHRRVRPSTRTPRPRCDRETRQRHCLAANALFTAIVLNPRTTTTRCPRVRSCARPACRGCVQCRGADRGAKGLRHTVMSKIRSARARSGAENLARSFGPSPPSSGHRTGWVRRTRQAHPPTAARVCSSRRPTFELCDIGERVCTKRRAEALASA